MVPAAPIITGVTFVFTFHMRCISVIKFLYFTDLYIIIIIIIIIIIEGWTVDGCIKFRGLKE
jgi:cytochrome c biogenesis protein CcdA